MSEESKIPSPPERPSSKEFLNRINEEYKKQRAGTVAKEIKRRREQLHISQKAAAERFGGIASSLWGHWETGNTQVKVEYLPRIAEVLGCTVPELLGQKLETATITPIDMPTAFWFADEAAFLEFAYNLGQSLSREQRKRLRQILTAVDIEETEGSDNR
ncbi:MAG: helix-turn-helix transcriptional regulator [Capsulimonadaceae bacterium]|nr:helix-turn-helix transcriptional regulator [Capsulimonadaceae bacterium]